MGFLLVALSRSLYILPHVDCGIESKARISCKKLLKIDYVQSWEGKANRQIFVKQMIYYRVFLSVFRIRVAKSNVHIPAHFIFKDTLVRFPGSFDFVHQDVVCCFVPWKVYLETQRVLFVVSHFGAALLLKCRVVIMVLKIKIAFTCLSHSNFIYYYKCCTMLLLHYINYRNGEHPHLIHHYNLLRRYIVVRQCSIHFHHCTHAYQGRS